MRYVAAAMSVPTIFFPVPKLKPAGSGVAVGGAGVAVGRGVFVGFGVSVAFGVSVGFGVLEGLDVATDVDSLPAETWVASGSALARVDGLFFGAPGRGRSNDDNRHQAEHWPLNFPFQTPESAPGGLNFSEE